MRLGFIAGKAGYAIGCVGAAVTLIVSGYAYSAVKAADSLGGSNAIVSGPSIGEQNILLMGLESRTDWNGNILPDNILKALHACNRQEIQAGCGGNATNTLILIHIFAGGKKAVGFSIPRDDWVTFPQTYYGQTAGKIDQAYGDAMAQKEGEVVQQNSSISQNQKAFAGNEAGRAAAVATVESLTGVHIDHFAEINLDGFYELAGAFHGVEVCLRHSTQDWYSGANFRKGYQHLNAKQALAFVRQRHGLTNGDLDRTHRQQAVIDYVMWKMKHQGLLSDIGQISSLLGVAKRYVITDSNWKLLEFATQLQALTGKNLTFRTLPVVNPDGRIAGQSVNIIDPVQIKRIVQQTFAAPPGTHSGHKHSGGGGKATHTPPASTVTVDVYNGTDIQGLAGRVSSALVQAGYKPGIVTTGSAASTTSVLYGAGTAANAEKIASEIGGTATASSSVPAGHVKILLSATATVPTVGGTTTGPTTGPTTSPSGTPNNGGSGGVVTVNANAKFGIPCVD